MKCNVTCVINIFYCVTTFITKRNCSRGRWNPNLKMEACNLHIKHILMASYVITYSVDSQSEASSSESRLRFKYIILVITEPDGGIHWSCRIHYFNSYHLFVTHQKINGFKAFSSVSTKNNLLSKWTGRQSCYDPEFCFDRRLKSSESVRGALFNHSLCERYLC